jgi:LCP family protein required for cell wall assembly
MSQETRPTRRGGRSAFVAAVLSLLFPGLGQLYAGAWRRAIAWAAAPVVLLLVGLGVILTTDRYALFGAALQSWFLTAVFIGNIALLGYRLLSVIDAWFVAGRPSDAEPRSWGLARAASVGGLLAVLLVTAGAHVAIAHYDSLATSLANCVFDATGTAQCAGNAATDEPTSSSAPPDTSEPTLSLPPVGTPLPDVTPPPWSGTDRLNILLVGVDQRPGQGAFNTDTMIVVSVDPVTARVAMFSIPRDTVDVPLPPGPLTHALGSVYTHKINSLVVAVRNRADLCPGASSQARGFNCLKSVLGYLYGLDIQYYAEVNFTGFTQVVDALGGVTIAVQSPVVDDKYPGDHGDLRVYIPTGVQHMDGAQALIYARSRHASNDFDRGARQQAVITSILAQTDINAILPRLDTLVAAFEQTVKTDVPRELLPKLLGLASKVDAHAIRSFVFAPPLYETEDYIPGVHDRIYPNAARIRAAVKTAFTSDPAFEANREKVAGEGATVWVLNGSNRSFLASDVANYLTYRGFDATAPTQKPPKPVASARIVIYNGAEDRLTATISQLESLFKVTVTLATDPTVPVDVVITVGASTTDLTPPPVP